MRRIRVTGPARRDVTEILQRSGAEFGAQLQQRYHRLIDQSLQDLADDAARPGVQSIDDIREGYYLHHLKWNHNAAGRPLVRHPRHLIAFFIDNADAIVVVRVFHLQALRADRGEIQPVRYRPGRRRGAERRQAGYTAERCNQ